MKKPFTQNLNTCAVFEQQSLKDYITERHYPSLQENRISDYIYNDDE
jgi:hypothetical protein